MLGETYWEWFYIDLIWVKDELRDEGYGKQLMELAEAEARRRGPKNAYLDTFSFQASGFYEGLGYEIFGELDNYPTGHRRYFMKTKLKKRVILRLYLVIIDASRSVTEFYFSNIC